jgi:hypothetical protein
MHWYRPILYLWVLPATLLGLLPVPIVLLQGGRAGIVRGVLEVHGSVVTRMLRIGLPWVGAGAAITFGHVVWGCDQTCLDRSREHERVHVRQYECLGPFFIPLYLLSSLIARCRGRDPYRDNAFERAAYERTAGR